MGILRRKFIWKLEINKEEKYARYNSKVYESYKFSYIYIGKALG